MQSGLDRLLLLRVDNDSRKKCYSTYRRDHFYHLPKPALEIINFCQKLSRDRLLQRDEILGAIAKRIEIRDKFMAWKVTAIVRIKQRMRILLKYLGHWHAQQKDTRLFRLYKQIYQDQRLKRLRELLERWTAEVKVKRMIDKIKLRLMRTHLVAWLEFLRYHKWLLGLGDEVRRRRLARLLRQWYRVWEASERRLAAAVAVGERMLTKDCWRRWSTLWVSRQHRRRLVFCLFQKKLLALFNRWKLAMRLEVSVNTALEVPGLPACLSPQPSRGAPVPATPKPSPKAVPLPTGFPIVPCKCIKQIRAGYRCISCSRQAHLARRLQLCRTEVDGLYSDAVAQTKATATRRKGDSVSTSTGTASIFGIADRSSVSVSVSVDDESVYSRAGAASSGRRAPTARTLSNSVLMAKKPNGATMGSVQASKPKSIGSGARRMVSLNRELRL